MQDITAILAIRNERPYLENCLSHLIDNGLNFYVIDNGSTDGTAEFLQQEPYRSHLVGYEYFPYEGYFDWTGLMQAREAAAARATTEWVLFVSADEIMHSYRPDETLQAAITRVAETGANVIDFNEFVFLPVLEPYDEAPGGWRKALHYYFFEPRKPRLMRARRRDLDVSHIDHGGHVLEGAEFQLAEESFALRHYIFRDQDHAYEKYTQRVFDEAELARGWHGNRKGFCREAYTLPRSEVLLRLEQPGWRKLDRSAPQKTHFWQWSSKR